MSLAIVQEAVDPATFVITGQLPGILLLAILLAATSSLVLLRMYRRAVIRSMSASAGAPHPGGRRASGPGVRAVATGPPRASAGPAGAADHSDESDTRGPGVPLLEPAASSDGSGRSLRDIRIGPWRNVGVYSVAGLIFALLVTVAVLLSGGIGISPLRLTILLWVYLWPITLTIYRVAAVTPRQRWRLTLGYFLILLALGAIAIPLSPELDWLQYATLWFVTNLPGTVLVLAFMNRRVRAVGPLVLIYMVLAVTGVNIVLSFVGSDDRFIYTLVDLGLPLGLAGEDIFLAMILFGFVIVGAPIGWFFVQRIRSGYERKRISDEMLSVDAIWLLFAVDYAIPLAFEGAWWVLSGLVAFVAYKLVTIAGFAFVASRWPPPKPAPRLLLLRVFALGRESERLFDFIGTHWQHVGSIQLIAGPDLATTTVEPHEFLDFLTGKLARRFISGPAMLEQRLSEMDLLPDRDGRFRVHDFYCFDDTWTMVLRRLVRESDAILMDLRGFTDQNAGCLFEVSELIDVAPLERVRFLVDDATDERFLDDSIAGFWSRMSPASPNFGTSMESIRKLRLGGVRKREFPGLMEEVGRLRLGNREQGTGNREQGGKR